MESVCPKTGDNYVLLDFKQFCEEIRNQVEGKLGEECEASIRSVVKNNHTEQTSITIRVGETNVMPAIYLEAFYREYKQGTALNEIVSNVVEIYEKNRNPWPNGLDFSFEGVRDKISFRLVNCKKNSEQLMNMPHVDFDEWAICFECVLTREGGSVGAVRIENSMMREWNIGLQELVRLASENMPRLIPPKVEPIEEVLAGILIARLIEDDGITEDEREEKTKEILDHILDRKEDAGIPMYVLSNCLNHYGACAILDIPFMDSVRERLKEDFYILPSSIHELILIPVSAAPGEDRMLEMVQEVNENEVPEDEFLSDGIYRYGTLRKKICAALAIE